MSVNLIFAQIPLVGEVTGAMQATPELQQTIAQQMAQETHKKEQSQVQKTDEQEGAKGVNPDANRDQGANHQANKRKRQAAQETEEAKEVKDPWAGNIINVRI